MQARSVAQAALYVWGVGSQPIVDSRVRDAMASPVSLELADASNSNFGPDAVEQGPRKVTTTVSHWAIVNNFVQNGRISVTLIDM